jgi:predicted regulator of Ras-like GTPase activity (Roadblock/LC7/MglB family)
MTSRTDKELRDAALVFYADDIEAIDNVLEAFLKKSGARCALLVDQDGHMITNRGQTTGVDLDTISALVAGSFAATKALAHQFGEKDFHALFHQGRTGNIQLSLVGERTLLTALFDDSTTIGMVRLYASEAAKRLTQLFRRRGRSSEGADVGGSSETFESDASGALDQMFGE